MNKERRRLVYSVLNDLNTVKTEINECITNITNINNIERYAYNNIPDSLIESERALASEEAQEILDDYLDDMKEMVKLIDGMNDRKYDI